MKALNLYRTHYTASQRAMFAAKRVNATASDGPTVREDGSCLYRDRIVTAGDAATAAGVGRNAVQQAKRLRREAAPEVVKAVEGRR